MERVRIIPIIARARLKAVSRRAKIGDAPSNQGSLPLITVAITMAAIAARPMAIAPMIAGRVNRPPAIRDRTRVPSSRVCANLTSANITNAGITNPGRGAANHARSLAMIHATPTIARPLAATKLAATTSHHAASSAMTASRAVFSLMTGPRAVSSATTANLWVDTNGGSCARAASPAAYGDAQACASFDAAYAAAQLGDTVLDVHRRIKEALDPMGLLNPGRAW